MSKNNSKIQMDIKISNNIKVCNNTLNIFVIEKKWLILNIVIEIILQDRLAISRIIIKKLNLLTNELGHIHNKLTWTITHVITRDGVITNKKKYIKCGIIKFNVKVYI